MASRAIGEPGGGIMHELLAEMKERITGIADGICCIERRAVSGQEQYFPCPRSKSTAHDHRPSGPPPLLLRSGGFCKEPEHPRRPEWHSHAVRFQPPHPGP